MKQTELAKHHDKFQGIDLTAETMQTNMSPLTDLNIHDQFAKPQLKGVVLLKKQTLHRTHIVHAYIALLHQCETKLFRKTKFEKKNEKCTNVSSRRL